MKTITLEEKQIAEFDEDYKEYILRAYPNKMGLYTGLYLFLQKCQKEIRDDERTRLKEAAEKMLKEEKFGENVQWDNGYDSALEKILALLNS